MIEDYVIKDPVLPIPEHLKAPALLKKMPSIPCYCVKASQAEMESAISEGCERAYQRYQQLMSEK